MLGALLQRFRRDKPAEVRTRSFDGAGGGRRWQNAGSFGAVNPETLAGAAPMRRRAQYYAHNNPHAAAGIEAHVSNLVGSGIRPASKHPDATTREAIQRAFNAWCSQADADGVLDFYAMQSLAAREMVGAGECFAHMVTDRTARGVPLKVRLIDAELVDVAHTMMLANGRWIVGGVEFDTAGRRAAYYLLRRQPTSLFTSYYPPIRISAADICHLFRPMAAGQVRGFSWFAPVLSRLNDLDKLEDANLFRAQLAAMFAGFVTDASGDPAAAPLPSVTGTDDFPVMEPGTIQSLPPGTDIRFSTPAEVTQIAEFMRHELRSIAAGLGVPDHLLSGDLSQVNYSSIRAALVEFRRRIESIQYGCIIHQFCRPIWERFIVTAVLSGVIDAPDFESRMDDYLAAEWYPPKQPWVDPLKDGQAEALAVASGFKSRRQVVAEQGYDIEDVDTEIASDQQREKALGLDFTVPKSDQRQTSAAS